MIVLDMVMLGLALLSVGIAGIAASKNFILIMFSMELIIVSASIIGVGIYTYAGGDIILLLATIWSVAAAELIVAIALYRYLIKSGNGASIEHLTNFRD